MTKELNMPSVSFAYLLLGTFVRVIHASSFLYSGADDFVLHMMNGTSRWFRAEQGGRSPVVEVAVSHAIL